MGFLYIGGRGCSHQSVLSSSEHSISRGEARFRVSFSLFKAECATDSVQLPLSHMIYTLLMAGRRFTLRDERFLLCAGLHPELWFH